MAILIYILIHLPPSYICKSHIGSIGSTQEVVHRETTTYTASRRVSVSRGSRMKVHDEWEMINNVHDSVTRGGYMVTELTPNKNSKSL